MSHLKQLGATALALLVLGAGCAHQPPAALSPPSPSDWTLAWSDEFDGDTLDRGKWVAETGGHGWGNNELQFYTDRPDNLRVGGGHLVIAVEWEPGEIRWYRDGIHYHTARPELVKGEWVFEHPFFVLLNLAVGGHWPGNLDSTTVLPQQMLVDYVRVYSRPGRKG